MQNFVSFRYQIYLKINVYYWRTPPSGEKGSYETTAVSRSASRSATPFSPKTGDEIFLKILMKLGCLKGKKLTKLDFLEKITFWG